LLGCNSESGFSLPHLLPSYRLCCLQNVGAELEFCLFDASSHNPVDQSVFGNSTTLNQQESFVANLYTQLRKQHIAITQIHTESAPGQLEVVLEYQQDPMKLADHVVLARETIRAVAAANQLCAVFLPKLSESQAGNGCHLHLSFRRVKDSKTSSQNAFPHAHLSNELSADGKSFIEGILRHLPALLAVSMPTQNSFRRVGPGCWTGSQLGWAVEDKESPLRVCVDSATRRLSNVEYKVCDSTANIYLCLACILGCGLNGIFQRCALRPSLDHAAENDKALPGTLKDSLTCLQEDSFLMNLLGPTLSRAYINVRNAEAARAADMTLEEEVKEALRRS
jgi:glutamine synthetase